MKETNQLSRIIEGALFAAEKPMSIDRLLELFDEQDRPEKAAIKAALEALTQDYAERGVELKELASGYQFQVRADLAKWIQRLWEERAPRYSRALLETLALIAYRQPITRGEVEDIRGVAVNTNITKTLLEREWVRIVGYRDVPGKPALFATTKEFLDYFGLRSLEELPPLNELQDLDKLGEHLEQRLQDENGEAIGENAEASAADTAETEVSSEEQNTEANDEAEKDMSSADQALEEENIEVEAIEEFELETEMAEVNEEEAMNEIELVEVSEEVENENREVTEDIS